MSKKEAKPATDNLTQLKDKKIKSGIKPSNITIQPYNGEIKNDSCDYVEILDICENLKIKTEKTEKKFKF